MAPLTLIIDTIGNRGVGIGRKNGKVVLVPFTAPGDEVEIRIMRSHRHYDEAVALRILTPSEWRQDPPCPAFGTCGGCHFQHLDYNFQLQAKKKLFREMVSHHGNVSADSVGNILSAHPNLAYRSRIECHATGETDVRLGFKKRGSHDIISLETCLLALPAIQDAVSQIPDLLTSAGANTVTMVDISADDPGNSISVTLQSSLPLEQTAIDLLASKAPRLSRLKSLFLRHGRTGSAQALWSEALEEHHTSYSLPLNTAGGQATLTVWPGVFRQSNPYGNRLLISTILKWVQESDSRRVLDLYAGMGNVTIPVSRLVKEITAVEVNAQAVKNGKDNARRLECTNITWVSRSVFKGLDLLIKNGERFDTIILDPPRSGAKDIIEKIAVLKPAVILYVSCDPATLSRDLRILQHRCGYTVKRSVPIDMFPQTFHLESVTLLHKAGT